MYAHAREYQYVMNGFTLACSATTPIRTHNAHVQLVHLYCILEDLAPKATGLQAMLEAPVVGSNHQDRLFAGMRFLNLGLHSRHFFTSGVSHTRTVCEAWFSVLRRCRNYVGWHRCTTFAACL